MTPDKLRAATGCTVEQAEAFAPLLAEACRIFEINTPVRLVDFLAQVGHESGGFKHLREIWGPTPAQERYEGRADLGNTQAGDGKRFMGRGLIQITGRFNYARVRDRLRAALSEPVPDFEQFPEWLEQTRWAVLSAASFWSSAGCNKLADADDFEGQTRKINGGLNGLADRKLRRARAQSALSGITREEITMLPALIAAVLPSIIEAVPKLGRIFGSGSDVSERNIKAAEIAIEIVKEATGARNAQEAAETVKADPVAAQAAAAAVESRWFELAEVGGGIDAARKADAAFVAAGSKFWESPSFWAMVFLLPLAYLVVGSVIGLWGTADWSIEIRAAIASAVVSLIVGGVTGYYWGSTTSRNRQT